MNHPSIADAIVVSWAYFSQFASSWMHLICFELSLTMLNHLHTGNGIFLQASGRDRGKAPGSLRGEIWWRAWFNGERGQRIRCQTGRIRNLYKIWLQKPGNIETLKVHLIIFAFVKIYVGIFVTGGVLQETAHRLFYRRHTQISIWKDTAEGFKSQAYSCYCSDKIISIFPWQKAPYPLHPIYIYIYI